MIRITRARKIQAALEELGETSSEIAGSLRKRGVMGIRQEASFCPLMNYLADREHLSYTVAVSRFYVTYETVLGRRRKLVIPSEFGDFVVEFDRGDYPGLDYDQADPIEANK